MKRDRLIRAALGTDPAELVLRNARVVNVFTGEILEADVAVSGGFIAGVGRYESACETVDLNGRYLIPGLINSHCHVESSMATPRCYCREELRHGVTTIITDPHEIANVAGLAGIQYMLNSSENAGVNYYVQLPSCVPATGFEHAGASLPAEDLVKLRAHPRVLGLGEMMNYPGVAGCDSGVLAKLDAFSHLVIDGHAPGIGGNALQAYAAAGIRTDHESVSWAEAREKLRAGMAVLVREGSASRNLTDILTGALQDGADTAHMAFCTDDKHLSDLRREGSVLHCIHLAVSLGLDPVRAIQMATCNAARIYGLRELGAIAPGYRADLVILRDLAGFTVDAVYKDGRLAVQSGALLLGAQETLPPAGRICQSVRLAPISAADLALPSAAVQPVIRIFPGQIVTGHETIPTRAVPAALASGAVRKIAVIERHRATGNVGVGLIAGYGLARGAAATTVAHDSHNLIVVGDNDADMLLAIREIERMQGGYCLVRGGEVKGSLPLPVAGLMSTESADRLLPALDAMLEEARAMGVAPGIDPFITLSFMALPVIPALRITDMGMFDVERFALIKEE